MVRNFDVCAGHHLDLNRKEALQPFSALGAMVYSHSLIDAWRSSAYASIVEGLLIQRESFAYGEARENSTDME
jgi:hypothetical protein